MFSVNLPVYAQKINGDINDELGIKVAGVTAYLHKLSDSGVMKIGISNNLGIYEFVKIKPGNYFIKISAVGYKNYRSDKFTYDGNDLHLPVISLSKNVSDLKGILVNATRPVIEVKTDKIIYNVENNIAANGLDGLELLRQSPGVLVDQEDNITIAGKSSVKIYIDGKPSPLSSKDLSSYLKSLRSTSIESIEIINNPSVKYEAAGTGGIINIRLKKNKALGTNGNINYDFQQALWPKHNAGFSLNHRSKNFNAFSNYNLDKSINEFDIDIFRNILDTAFDSYSANISHNSSHNVKAGIDFFINKESTIGVLINGNYSINIMDGNNYSLIRFIPTNKTDRVLISNNKDRSSRKNTNINLNYRFSITNGRELNLDADYGIFDLRANQFQPNIFFDSTQTNILYQNNYRMETPADINIYGIKADYEQNVKKGRLGIGARIAFIKSDNIFNFYNLDINHKLWYDSVLSNMFIYKENINAFYANYNRGFKYFQIQFGVRAEQTITSGTSTGFEKQVDQTFTDYYSAFKRNLFDFFPNGSVTYTKNPKSQWTISYGRRINRPSYQDLNPFERRSSEYGGSKGNPNLRPEYANTFSLTNVFRSKLVTTLSYSHTKDVIAQISDTFNGTKSFYFPKNLATQDNISLNSNYSYNKKWYSVSGSITGFFTHNQANFGAGRIVDLSVVALRASMQNVFTLGKGWKSSLSGSYSSPSLFRGTLKANSLYGANAGVQKTVMREKGTFRLNFNDIFNTMHWYGTSNFGGQYLIAKVYWEPRRVIAGFSYKFGSNQVKSARQRKSGLDEETKRTNESNF